MPPNPSHHPIILFDGVMGSICHQAGFTCSISFCVASIWYCGNLAA